MTVNILLNCYAHYDNVNEDWKGFDDFDELLDAFDHLPHPIYPPGAPRGGPNMSYDNIAFDSHTLIVRNTTLAAATAHIRI